MTEWYTLPEIARITGIPLSELQADAIEFADLLPLPRPFPAAASPADPAPVPPQKQALPSRGLLAPFRRLWRRWCAALRRLLAWPMIRRAIRLLLQAFGESALRHAKS